MESRIRSIVKTVIYRIIVIVLLAAITYYYTGNLGQTTTISLVFNASGSIIYYAYERFWDHLEWKREAVDAPRQ